MPAVGEGGFHAGVFATMKFPKYKYQEYPKWVEHNGVRQIVQDQVEELRLKATVPVAREQTELERERDHIMVERDGLANVVASKDAEIQRLREEMAKLQSKPAIIDAAEPAIVKPAAPPTAKK